MTSVFRLASILLSFGPYFLQFNAVPLQTNNPAHIIKEKCWAQLGERLWWSWRSGPPQVGTFRTSGYPSAWPTQPTICPPDPQQLRRHLPVRASHLCGKTKSHFLGKSLWKDNIMNPFLAVWSLFTNLLFCLSLLECYLPYLFRGQSSEVYPAS